jgi:hypothetical protein
MNKTKQFFLFLSSIPINFFLKNLFVIISQDGVSSKINIYVTFFLGGYIGYKSLYLNIIFEEDTLYTFLQ